MKKIIFTFSVILASISGAKAQAPDFNFESWANVQFGTLQDPQGWASLNTLNIVGTAQSLFKETVTPFAGTASAKITTVKVVGASIPNPYTGGNLDTAGVLAIGKVNLSPPGFNYGYTYAWRPAVLSFESKYTPVGGDSAFVLVYLTKWNTTTSKRDTVATGKYGTGANTSSYLLNSITMNYSANVMPDSEQIFVSSSVYSHGGAKIGSAFYVDAFAWSGYNSVNELNGIENNVSYFPNPATNTISFKSSIDASFVEVFDITGRNMGSFLMKNNTVKIATENYTPGFYLFTILNDKKEIVNRGKFEVVK